MQTLITSNNKESDKLRNLNVHCYYNASGMGDTICSIGEEINKPLIIYYKPLIMNNMQKM